MEILIQHRNLIDFPYDPVRTEYHSLFAFDQPNVSNLVAEILHSSPSCYLVSGYRGSGKTSFIRRVQQLCSEQFKKTDKQKGIIFVYSSFSRFESKTIFLRKIIRDLQETVARQLDLKNKATRSELKNLYTKTFYEITHEESQETSDESSAKTSLDLEDFFKKLSEKLAPLLILFTNYVLEPLYLKIPWGWVIVIKLLIFALSFGLTVLGLIKFSAEYTYKETNRKKKSKVSLSDDNITEYELETVLDNFVNGGYKIIFILDELDKVDDDELSSLLKEMKPWLVKGQVDFILVAGQKLTMKYYDLKERDDEILSSLFSKIIHVSPLTDEVYWTIFRDFLFMGWVDAAKNTEKKTFGDFDPTIQSQIRQQCDRFIYQSKRLPRTFMNLVRQELIWTSETAVLPVISRSNTDDIIKTSIVKEISDQLQLNANVPKTVQGHLVMQLYRCAGFINEKNKSGFKVEDLEKYILDKDDKGVSGYPYPKISPLVSECISDFYLKALDRGLVTKEEKKEATGEGGAEQPEIKSVGSEDEPAIRQFRVDFMSLISVLLQLKDHLVPSLQNKGADKLEVGELFAGYQQLGILDFPDTNNIAFAQPVSGYSNRVMNSQIFAMLFQLFTREQITIKNLFYKLFNHYTKVVLQEVFTESEFIIEWRATQPSPITTDYLIRSHRQFDAFDLLFDYTYIDGPVSVSEDQINRSISVLNEYNLQSGRGNYYHYILFYKSETGFDSAEEELKANYRLEILRPDIRGKIKFWIISVSTAGQLGSNVQNLKETAKPYFPKPIVFREANFKKKKHKIAFPDPTSSPTTIFDPEDPQKGRWGYLPSMNFKTLTGSVRKDEDREGWYFLDLVVSSTFSAEPLTGKVTFYLHPTFSPDQITVLAKDGTAKISDLPCYEAFTVGASCDNNITKLELDLNTLPNLPEGFGYEVEVMPQ